MAGLIIVQPNFGTAIVLLITAAMMFFVGRARIGHLLGTAAVAAPCCWL